MKIQHFSQYLNTTTEQTICSEHPPTFIHNLAFNIAAIVYPYDKMMGKEGECQLGVYLDISRVWTDLDDQYMHIQIILD